MVKVNDQIPAFYFTRFINVPLDFGEEPFELLKAPAGILVSS